MLNFTPIGDKVLVEPIIEKESTVGGIIVPQTAQDTPSEGIVVALGTGEQVKGRRTEFEVKIGDRVFFSRFEGTQVKIGSKLYKMLKANEILAIIE